MNLMEARQRAGLTREVAAVRLGIAVATLARWETGFPLGSQYLPAIKELYNLTAEEALALTGQKEAS